MKKNYEEGDIIYINGNLRVCDIAGKSKAKFDSLSISSTEGTSANCHDKSIILPVEMSKRKEEKKSKCLNPKFDNLKIKYPVVGRLDNYSSFSTELFWNLRVIRRTYPKLEKRIKKHLRKRIGIPYIKPLEK